MRLRVPVGIDRDENDLDAIAIGSQSFQIGGQLHQGARADVWAEREAEEKCSRQAGDVALGERSTVLGDQIESDTWAGGGRRGRYRGKKHNHDEPGGRIRLSTPRASQGPPAGKNVLPGQARGWRVRLDEAAPSSRNLAREPDARQCAQLHIVPILYRGRGGSDPADLGELGNMGFVAIGVTGEAC